MMISKGSPVDLRENTAPVPLCSAPVSYGYTQHRTRGSAVRSHSYPHHLPHGPQIGAEFTGHWIKQVD